MSKQTKIYIFVIAIFIVLFSYYNYIIYTTEAYSPSATLSPQAIEGMELWQKNNCWSCHQIYGLGGYLGPDLTNVYSHPDKGPSYISAFLNSGIMSMPKFDFSPAEKEAIIEYLRVIDQTGYYPNYNAKVEATGWVNIQYKNEE